MIISYPRIAFSWICWAHFSIGWGECFYWIRMMSVSYRLYPKILIVTPCCNWQSYDDIDRSWFSLSAQLLIILSRELIEVAREVVWSGWTIPCSCIIIIMLCFYARIKGTHTHFLLLKKCGVLIKFFHLHAYALSECRLPLESQIIFLLNLNIMLWW